MFSAVASGQELEEIIVTAQKRAENIQDVPISVSALTGESVDKFHATSLKDLQGVVPNVQINNFPNTPNSAVFTIRGIGVVEPDPFAGNTVSIVQDGVPQYFSMGALLDLFDVERIEVLRGPQGTLFGANTTGGAVNITTAAPTGEFGGKAELTVGDWDRVDVKAAMDFPIVADVLAGKLAVLNHRRDGWVTNIMNGNDMGSRDLTVVRGYLKLTPKSMPNLESTLALEYAEARNGSPPVSAGTQPGDIFYVPPGTMLPGQERPMYANPCPSVTSRCRAPNRYYSASELRDQSDLDTYRVTLTTTVDDTAIGDITAITGYKKFDAHELTDNDGTALAGIDTNRKTEGWQFSQEIRSEFDVSESVNFLVGGFFMKTRYDHEADLTLDFALPGLRGFNTQKQDNWSASLFAQGYFDLSDRLRLQAGLRYTHEDTEMTATDANFVNLDGPAEFGVGIPAGGFVAKGDESWDEMGWKIGLDYRVADDVMLYGYYARGFKSGGFVGRINAPAAIGPYDPETVDTIELGMKADFLNHRLRTNLSTFYMDYKDMQVAQNFIVEGQSAPIGTTIYNAAKATIWGAELELSAVLFEGLTLTGSVAYLNTEYDEFITTDQQDLSGKDLQNSPEITATLGVNYRVAVGPGTADAGILYTHTGDKYLQGITNPPMVNIQATDFVRANLSWTPDSERWTIELWANNLLDKRYIDSVTWNPGLFTQVFYTPPREYGLTFKYYW